MNDEQALHKENIRLQRELQEKDQLLQETILKGLVLLHSCPDAIVIINKEGTVIEVNRVFSAMTGFEKEQVINKSVHSLATEFSAQDDRCELFVLISNLQSSEDLLSHEMLCRGRVFELSISKYFAGSEIRTIFLRDITERKLAQEALLKSQGQYRSLIEEINDVVYAINEKGVFTYISPVIEHIAGYTPFEMIGKSFTEFIYVDDIPPIMARFDELKSGITHPSEYRIVSKSGMIIWIRSFSKPVLVEGKFTGLKGIFMDITEYKQSEIELQQYREHLEELVKKRTIELTASEERFRIAAQSMNDLIWDWNILHNTITWFGDIDGMLGYASGEFPGTFSAWEKMLHPEDHDRVMAALHNHLTTKSPFSEEYRIVRKDGVHSYWMQRGTALWNENGSPYKMISACTDITSHKEAEQWIIEHAARLAALNSELERSNRDLEQFAYVASHDLQEPLRMISSFAHLLENRYQGKLDKSADEFIQYITEGARRMQLMINDLLTYSRLATQAKEPRIIDCEKVLNQVEANLRTIIQESGASIQHEPLPSIVADYSQMVQLFQNFVGNAIKFRSNNKPVIQISVESKEKEWLFSVRDNGIGIDPEHFGRVFVIFQRLHSIEEYPGTGMGLSICKKIIENQNGKIWLESERGKGSVFYFTIPKPKNNHLIS
jgi:PAS domain S-box-containing protein